MSRTTVAGDECPGRKRLSNSKGLAVEGEGEGEGWEMDGLRKEKAIEDTRASQYLQ